MKTWWRSPEILVLLMLAAICDLRAYAQSAPLTKPVPSVSPPPQAEDDDAMLPRVLEVEDYLTRRAQEYLSVRFPQRPYSIVVHVTPQRAETTVRPSAVAGKKHVVSLPYLEVGGEPEQVLDDWVRKDVPIEDLLGHVKQIRVTLNVPGEVSDDELKLLRQDLGARLRLDAGRDTLEIAKREWAIAHNDPQKPEQAGARGLASTAESRSAWARIVELGPIFFLSLLLLTIGLGWLWFLSGSVVSRLVKGLSTSLSDLWSKMEGANPFGGRGQMASQAFLEAAQDGSGGSDSAAQPESSGGNSVDVRRAVKELLVNLGDLLTEPQPDVMEVIEEQGHRSPRVVGSALLELDSQTVQSLFAVGHGEWWFQGLLDSDPVSAGTLELLERLNAVKNRRPFDPRAALNPGERKLALLLGRLDDSGLESFFSSYPFKDAAPALRMLRMSRALAVAKLTFPQEWSALVAPQPSTLPMSPVLLKAMSERALSIKPLRSPEQIRTFFKDLDLRRYLDVAPPSDERDVYQVLAADSAIVRTRRPFFNVLSLSAQDIALFAGVVTHSDWAVALHGLEGTELTGFLGLFSERQRYFLNEALEGCRQRPPARSAVADCRRKIVRHMTLIQDQNATERQTGENADNALAA